MILKLEICKTMFSLLRKVLHNEIVFSFFAVIYIYMYIHCIIYYATFLWIFLTGQVVKLSNGNQVHRKRSKSPKIAFGFRIYENARAVWLGIICPKYWWMFHMPGQSFPVKREKQGGNIGGEKIWVKTWFEIGGTEVEFSWQRIKRILIYLPMQTNVYVSYIRIHARERERERERRGSKRG